MKHLTSWSWFVQLLNEISMCWCELKQTSQALVGLDPELFPLPENINCSLTDLTASEIRAAAAKKSTKSQSNWDRDHISTTVNNCLNNLLFLNDPSNATVRARMCNVVTCLMVLQGEALASPALTILCWSFYQEEKWQWALAIHLNRDMNEWATSVTVTMVSLTATSVCIHSTKSQINFLT